MGGGGVGLIPCDLDCINRVDSSLHFYFFFGEFCVDFVDFFFKVVLGSDGSRWIVVGGGGLYLWLWEVVEGCACVWW